MIGTTPDGTRSLQRPKTEHRVNGEPFGGGDGSSMEGQRELCLWNSRTCIGEITGVWGISVILSPIFFGK